MARSHLPEIRLLRPILSLVLILSLVVTAAGQAQVKEVDYGPDVLELTPEVLAAFEKGLRAEIALRDALRKQIAARRTQEQYRKCTMDEMLKPENLKFMEKLGEVTTDAKPEEAMGRMMRFSAASQARLDKVCGTDPGYGGGTVTTAQLEAIEQKAVSVAGPIPPGAKEP